MCGQIYFNPKDNELYLLVQSTNEKFNKNYYLIDVKKGLFYNGGRVYDIEYLENNGWILQKDMIFIDKNKIIDESGLY